MTKVLPANCEFDSAFATSLSACAAGGPILSELKSKLMSISMLGLSLASVASFSRSSGATESAVFFFNDSTKFDCSGVVERLRVVLCGERAFKILSAKVGSSAWASCPLAYSKIAAPSDEKVNLIKDLLRLTCMGFSYLIADHSDQHS